MTDHFQGIETYLRLLEEDCEDAEKFLFVVELMACGGVTVRLTDSCNPDSTLLDLQGDLFMTGSGATLRKAWEDLNQRAVNSVELNNATPYILHINIDGDYPLKLFLLDVEKNNLTLLRWRMAAGKPQVWLRGTRADLETFFVPSLGTKENFKFYLEKEQKDG